MQLMLRLGLIVKPHGRSEYVGKQYSQRSSHLDSSSRMRLAHFFLFILLVSTCSFFYSLSYHADPHAGPWAIGECFYSAANPFFINQFHTSSRPRISYHPLNKSEVVSYLSAWLPDASCHRVSCLYWIIFIPRSDCLVHYLNFRLESRNHRIDILKHR
jgi:hypothetical protein